MNTTVELRAKDVVKAFGPRSKRHVALDGVNLVLTEGQRLGIVGESGSGRSTMSRILVGLESPTTGAVEYCGKSVADALSRKPSRLSFRKDVQFVGQDTTSSFDPRRTLLDAVTAPLVYLRGMSEKDAIPAALETLRTLELDPTMARRLPSQVSGGQRQRFALARSLVVEPRILICDEVVSALDVSVQGAILNLLKRYCVRSGAALVFVSHDLPATAFITDDLIVMHNGKIVESGKSRLVLNSPADAYTQSLVQAYRGKGAA